MQFVINFVALAFNLWSFALLARVFVSWLNVNPYNPMVSFLYAVTEPILAPLRRVIPAIGMIDITPIVALLLMQFAERLILTLLWSLR